MKLISRKVLKDVEEDQVSLLPEDPEDMVRLSGRFFCIGAARVDIC